MPISPTALVFWFFVLCGFDTNRRPAAAAHGCFSKHTTTGQALRAGPLNKPPPAGALKKKFIRALYESISKNDFRLGFGRGGDCFALCLKL